jgi:hypothetical protein
VSESPAKRKRPAIHIGLPAALVGTGQPVWRAFEQHAQPFAWFGYVFFASLIPALMGTARPPTPEFLLVVVDYQHD